jgi:sialic acid synthase SpsE
VKRLAASEARNYSRTNRSIHATTEIRRGERLDAGKLAILRTEKVLRPGLDPELLPRVTGRGALRDIASGEGLEWEDVGGYGV